MPQITVEVKSKGNVSDLLQRVLFGASTGLDVGGGIMADVVKTQIGDMARYPTGELAATVQYESISDGVVSEGRIVAGTDHVEEFEYGTSPHFVPYEEADERIKQGLYPHIKPVYESLSSGSGGTGAYGGAGAGGNDGAKTRTPIGYIAYGDEHPFMEAGFGASYKTVVQEVINQIETATGD